MHPIAGPGPETAQLLVRPGQHAKPSQGQALVQWYNHQSDSRTAALHWEFSGGRDS